VLPGGDYIEDTVHEAQNVTHTVNGTSKILATNGLLNGLSSSFKKSGNMDFILWTESSGGNCTYYNVSTPQKPILLISLKDSTPNRSGKTTSVISIPSL
jgi:hypothetical protein